MVQRPASSGERNRASFSRSRSKSSRYAIVPPSTRLLASSRAFVTVSPCIPALPAEAMVAGAASSPCTERSRYGCPLPSVSACPPLSSVIVIYFACI